SALVAVTAPKLAQVVPSVEYCQVPFPVLPVMASPLSALVSTSAQLAPVKIVLAVVPLEVVFSSVPERVTVAPLVIVGASFTAVTVMDRFSVSVSAPPLAVPPESCTVQVRFPLPLASATVLYLSP